MDTPKAAANRRNAKASTGPRTAEGKAIAAANATKHGLTAREVVTVGESAADFEAFAADFVAPLAPVGELERELANRAALCSWRLRRAVRVEAATLKEPAMFDRDQDPLLGGFRRSFHTVEKVMRYERAIEGSMFRALHELQRLQAARAGGGAPLPVAVDVVVAGDGPGDADEIPF